METQLVALHCRIRRSVAQTRSCPCGIRLARRRAICQSPWASSWASEGTYWVLPGWRSSRLSSNRWWPRDNYHNGWFADRTRQPIWCKEVIPVCGLDRLLNVLLAYCKHFFLKYHTHQFYRIKSCDYFKNTVLKTQSRTKKVLTRFSSVARI
jgi:hypothetical protein